MVTKQLLQELQTIIKEEYQLDLTDEEAEELGNTLVGCYQILSEQETL